MYERNRQYHSSAGGPRPVPKCKNQEACFRPAMASELPQLTTDQLAKCQAAQIVSKDDGQTFTKPTLMKVRNSLGPHYTGSGLNHGIEIQNGPHAGRLAYAMRFDCGPGGAGGADYMRAYVLYSDDQGQSWTAGQLLPAGWTCGWLISYLPGLSMSVRRC